MLCLRSRFKNSISDGVSILRTKEIARFAFGEAVEAVSEGLGPPFFKLPVYLEEAVQSYLAAKAQAKGVDLSDLVNDLLKKKIELIETVK